MLAGPLAAGTYLLLINWRVAIRWGLLALALVGATWLALDLVTHGQYAYHVWVLHKLPWYAHRFEKLVVQLRDAWPLMLLGAIGIAASRRRPTVINAYLLWAPASLIGAVGSHHNHLLETGMALALAGGQAVGFGLTRGGALRIIAPVLLATQLLFWRAPLPWFVGEFAPEKDYARYIRFIEATPGEILADDVGLVYAAGKPLRYDDPAAMGPAAALGLWDQSNLVAEIRAQRFSVILLEIDVFADGLDDTHDRWTKQMLDAVRDAYEIKFRDTIIIYAPRPAAP
jgi:MFS family permease